MSVPDQPAPARSGTRTRIRTRTRSRRAAQILFSLIPFLGICAAVPFVNRVTPYVFGLPFLEFWMGAWTVLTAGCMTAVYRLEPRGEGPR